ncbi:cell division protein FtsZ [Dictyobacter arantiisoli]|uniref:Cell division protein FtsZ n=1 Tax=Dictyobacter arantiisoli TaxID=2014874 RepID=A0A5A5TKQ7_9CHLR|nr:cell division protein FtsZ [Dictyobacter arantiisoli]GCF11862.1 hypothetical protein KDI_54260 [Dictyobacter arantiisoli]
MQPMSNDAYKRNMGSGPRIDRARNQPDAYEEQYPNGGPFSQQYSFDSEVPDEAPHHVDIVVVGVGGGGMNAINRMIDAGVRGVRFIAMNTDAQVLALCEAPKRICLGQHQTKGLGAGGNAAVGMRAATESSAEIREALGDADLVFIAAGMGGGTGTGAAPIVAAISKKLGALTVGIVTLPFTFEGSRRRRIADQGLADLSAEIDALITVPNDRLLSTVARDRNLSDAFKVADDILRQGVQGIAEVINVPGMINVDFADVRSVLLEAGTALMSIGQGTGRERAQIAADEAIAGGFLNVTIKGAKRVLFNISGGEDMTLFEVNEVAERIGNAIDDTADIIFGAVIDPALTDTIHVTLIAAGMEDLHNARADAFRSQQFPSPRITQSNNGLGSRSATGGSYGAGRASMGNPTPAPQPRTLPPNIQPVQPATPPPAQIPPALRPYNPPASEPENPNLARQQRNLNQQRGPRGRGLNDVSRRYHPTSDQEDLIDPPPFIKRYD